MMLQERKWIAVCEKCKTEQTMLQELFSKFTCRNCGHKNATVKEQVITK